MKPTHKLAMPNGRNKTSDPINISKIISPTPEINQYQDFLKK
jgi:hypothetical protein